MFRIVGNKLEVFLVHPGGPYWRNKDVGSWGIPKGEVEERENLIEAAKREFNEETGITPEKEFIELGSIKYSSGKTVYAWAFETNNAITNFLPKGFSINSKSRFLFSNSILKGFFAIPLKTAIDL